MLGLIANTDYDWYTFLAARDPRPDEVNFWQPSGGQTSFKAISPGEPFFFKLKAPHNAIAGFGWFARHEQQVRSSLAWDAFRENNGAATLEEMRRRIVKYTGSRNAPGGDPVVGCLMIAQPVFFDESQWVEQPSDWKKNIVSYKGYDLESGEGRRIFEACLARMPRSDWPKLPAGLSVGADAGGPRYGEPTAVQPRLGQGIFRVALTSAYGGACAVTGEHSGPVLEAAHIQPFSRGGEHVVPNGLLLRADIHKLFDAGYVTITPEYRFEVSARLKDVNGRGSVIGDGRGKSSRLGKSRPRRFVINAGHGRRCCRARRYGTG